MSYGRRYPDPDSVVYPTTAPPRFPLYLTTDAKSRMYPIHHHDAAVDKDGNGNTDVVASHFHYVRNGRVLPDQSDGHVHQLTNLPAGAG